MLWLALRQPRGRLGRVGGTVAESASPGGLVLAGGGLFTEDRFARGGVRLGVVVGKQLGMPRRVRGIDGCARPRAAGLIEVCPRVHDGGAAADRLVMDFWIREARRAIAPN